MYIKIVLITIIAIASGHNSPNSTDIFLAHEHTDNVLQKSSFDNVPQKSAFGIVKNNIDDGINAAGHAPAPISSDDDDKQVIVELRPKHSDIDYRSPVRSVTPPATQATPVPIPKDEEDVIFIKNEREPERNSDFHNDYPREDVISMKDVLRETSPRSKTTEGPKDILFISGKNHENLDKTEVKSPKPGKHMDTGRIGELKKKKYKYKEFDNLDCSQMTRYVCNNTVKSVCGEKKEGNRPKYRLFLNDCYFKKVNCDFKYEYNRYRKVSIEDCRWITTHNIVTNRPAELRAFAPFNDPPDLFATKKPKTRRYMDGRQCTHPCPMMCPEDYVPECGVSASGVRRVFTNHCEMDYNSCIYGTSWQKRPLSVCVGKMKAEIQENKRWIHYMQRVGLVDKYGHMVPLH